jgi:hypothetical protein
MATEAIHETRPAPKCVGVMVRTPAGTTSAFAVDREDTAGELIDRSVAYFVAREELEPGSFRLGLVRDAEIIDLDARAKLFDHGVVEGDVFHLINCEPQVDGVG